MKSLKLIHISKDLKECQYPIGAVAVEFVGFVIATLSLDDGHLSNEKNNVNND